MTGALYFHFATDGRIFLRTPPKPLPGGGTTWERFPISTMTHLYGPEHAEALAVLINRDARAAARLGGRAAKAESPLVDELRAMTTVYD